MNKIFKIFIFMSLICRFAYADVEGQIRKQISKIETIQKKIGNVIVLNEFSRLIDSRVSARLLQDGLINSNQNFSQIDDQFFDFLYSDKSESEKSKDLVNLLVDIRNKKSLFLELGVDVKQSYKNIFTSLKSSDVCSQEKYYMFMTSLNNIQELSIDTSKLKNGVDFMISGGITFTGSEVTQVNVGVDNITPQERNEAEKRHAISTTVSAAILKYAPPPWNVIGSIASFIAIEVVWGILDMADQIKEMKAIAEANSDLFDTLHFEINIKKHYLNQCEVLKEALSYTQILISTKNVDELKVEAQNLFQSFGSDFNYENLLDSNIYDNKENYRKFLKMNILSKWLLASQGYDTYQDKWRSIDDQYLDYISNIESVIYQLAKEEISSNYNRYGYVMDILNSLDSLKQLKSKFNDLLMKYFILEDDGERVVVIDSMKLLLTSYRKSHDQLISEEKQYLENYEMILKEIQL
ncbi:hypothetical protein HBN50_13595 [Halobacteriovorax sp. GB3]|uniref:hypothetical protein n=1 Tax=Halobacteriovorax sp. GB3 TaxID=2719615 RepID=UPI0023610943|nr:hypothetical protein [Halobacteriovorax sp. GB3]MDD0854141.1 hypothetical protein [Halobacteriovorax sp. GB3]